MKGFEFAAAGRILFGCGMLEDGISASTAWGRQALVVTGQDPKRADRLCEGLAARGVEWGRCRIVGEPTVEGIARIRDRVSREPWDFVCGVGGGSVIDGAKALAALLVNSGPVIDYLEVIGGNRPLSRPSLPVMAVPTTAGTGAEVTRNAVLASKEHRVKVSMRSEFMLPRLAVVDPELTVSMPPAVTASTGLDALTQLLEALVSIRANPMTDALCREGLRRGAGALENAFLDGADLAARESMAFASLMGGLGLANAGLGAVHGFAGPIGGMFPAAHGMICAALLPHVMAANIQALHHRGPESPALSRYREVSVLLTGDDGARAEDGALWAAERCRRLGAPRLGELGLSTETIPIAAAAAEKASSMRGNPVRLTRRELEAILEAAM